ncbi:MAG: DUF4157 domain-containing protein [Candidatus Methylomirabilales bacterium]
MRAARQAQSPSKGKSEVAAKARQQKNAHGSRSPGQRHDSLHPVLQLQQTIGNQAVSSLIQAKRNGNQRSEPYQQRTTRVMVSPAPRVVQRKCTGCATAAPCSACEAEERELVQRKAGPGVGTASIPDNVFQNSGVGWPLDLSTREFMESRFGHDFSQVRLHADAQAARDAKALNAQAFTIGRDIYFGASRYQPNTTAGRHLLAHELTHTVQQGSASTGAFGGAQARLEVSHPGDGLEREADRVASRVVGGDAHTGAITAGGAGLVQRIELPSLEEITTGAEEAFEEAVEAGEAAGEAIVAGVTAAGEAVGEAAETVAGIARELWDEAQALANALSGAVTVSGGKLVITVPPLPVCPTIPLQFPLPEIGRMMPFIEGVLPITGVVNVYGAVGLHIGLTPEISAQLGPCQLHGLRIVIDPLSRSFSASGGLTVTTALGLGGELRGALRGEVGVLIIWPDPPLVIQIPVAGIEAGLAGFGRGIVATTVTISGSMSYAGGRFSLRASHDADIGLGVDLGLAGYGAIDLLGQNLCTLYWPLWEWHDDVTVSSSIDLDVDISSSGASVDLDLSPPQIDQIAFDDLPLELQRDMFSDDCPVCGALYALGLMPSQRGGAWTGHPTPPWPGPLWVYPRNPGIPSGALCRGACGPDCDTCDNLGDVYVCDELGDGRHVIWKYPDYTECPTHQGCRDHDACYDWCAAGGETSILGPCHRLCDFECICSHSTPECVSWIFGAGGDDYMYFSDQPSVIGGCRGPCPEPIESIEPGAGPALHQVCLPDIPVFDRQQFSRGWSDSTGNVTLYATVVDVPYIGPVVLSVFARGDARATIGAGIGPAWLANLCLVVDPTIPHYAGTAELHVKAGLEGLIALAGTVGGRADWLCLVEVIRAEGGLEATGLGSLEAELVGAVEVSCRGGEITLETDVSLDTCLGLGFLLDAFFKLFLFKFSVISERWNLVDKRWDKCWHIPITVIKGTVAGGAGLAPNAFPLIDAGAIDLADLLSWLFRVAADDRKFPVLPPDPAKAANSDNPCGDVEPEDECGSPTLPLTHVSFTGSDRGERMVANPLTKCRGNTTGAGPPRTRHPGWNCIVQAPGNETDFWVHAHLLHGKTGARDLHGPDEPRNLIITDKSINRLMFTRVERDAIDRTHNQDQVLSYRVTARHLSSSGDRRYFADGMAITLNRIDPLTGQIIENIFSGTITSGVQRPVPANCT